MLRTEMSIEEQKTELINKRKNNGICKHLPRQLRSRDVANSKHLQQKKVNMTTYTVEIFKTLQNVKTNIDVMRY